MGKENVTPYGLRQSRKDRKFDPRRPLQRFVLAEPTTNQTRGNKSCQLFNQCYRVFNCNRNSKRKKENPVKRPDRNLFRRGQHGNSGAAFGCSKRKNKIQRNNLEKKKRTLVHLTFLCARNDFPNGTQTCLYF